MPILTMQQRARELGRIRIGKQTPTKGGKTRPDKLDTFRFTSDSEELITRVAELYGGDVSPWQAPSGINQYEVISESKRVPVLMPPQPITQWFEVWSGGGIQRRCDGLDEQVSGGKCLCTEGDMPCKPTTRLNVMLQDLAALGLWRLESHGWYAAQELPGLAAFLSTASEYVPAWLEIQPRQIKKPDEKFPRNFYVPVIDVEQSPRALLAGAAKPPVQAIEAQPVVQDAQSFLRAANSAESIEELQGLWGDAQRAGVLTEDLKSALTDLAKKFSPKPKPVQAVPQPVETVPTESADTLWNTIVMTSPENWTSQDVEYDFKRVTGVDAEQAEAVEMQVYLASVKR